MSTLTFLKSFILTLILLSLTVINPLSFYIEASSKKQDKKNSSKSEEILANSKNKKINLPSIKQDQSELFEIMPSKSGNILKKRLKKALSLEYSDPSIQAQINKNQEEEILKSLKKWKKELPVDNKFSLTGIIKSNDSLILYMGSSTPNKEFDDKKSYSLEDFETSDLRYTTTEFRIYLKNNGNDKWKAIIQGDSTNLNDIKNISNIELSSDAKERLFDISNSNTLTETEDVLIDFNSTSSQDSSSILSSSFISPDSSNSSSNISSNSTISSLISSSSVILDSSQNALSSISTSTSSSKKLSWVDSILSFGSVSVSAGANDYSWPWKNGETWNVNSGQQYVGRGGTSNGWHAKTEEGDTLNRGLDLMVPNSYYNSTTSKWNDIPVLVPKSGTITGLCSRGDNYFVRIDDMYIWHVAPKTFTNGASVTKGDVLGSVATGTNQSGNVGASGLTSNCGSGTGAHLHIKLMSNSMNSVQIQTA
jgi:hypothetical protein